MKRIKCLALWTTALLVANLATAQAQVAPPTQNTPQGGMMGPGSGTPMMGGPARMGVMGWMGMADHVDGRLAFLKAELKITEAQTSQWNAFSDALRENARRMGGMSATMMQGGMMGHGGASMTHPIASIAWRR
jgi:hypothetical protein